MAIQLNERDHLIFKYVEEHQVLLEKHISWFISVDRKPVLIRDRLRKLFYLDYLLCERHKNTLPWWTTPTKPLVYTLAPLTQGLIQSAQSELDLSESGIQRHLLEIANLRMLLLMDESAGLISDLEWTTCNAQRGGCQHVDAKLSFTRNGLSHRIGLINHPESSASPGAAGALAARLEAALDKDDIETVWIVSRDDEHQLKLQECLRAALVQNSIARGSLAFSTHIELYNKGTIKAHWETEDQRIANQFVESIQEARSCALKQPKTATA